MMSNTTYEQLRQRARSEWKALEESGQSRILVGTATCGRAAGGLEVLQALDQQLRNRGLDCRVMEVGCIGLCHAEPIVTVFRPSGPGVVYGNVAPAMVEKLVESCLAGGPLAAGALGTIGPGGIEGIPRLADTPVFQGQVRRVLANCGAIDPGRIDHYLAHDGYSGFAKALAWPPQRIIEEIKTAGLRGRGGAGFPTWRKWQFCQQAAGQSKYLICNADEGDPGAFMNRSLLEGDPHSLLEGMLVAGRALGAATGYIYCRAEYPLALERLRTAITQAEQYGLLGQDILGSGFDFHVHIKEGAGAFVCGEETALIASIEGQRGMPRPRPPFPAISGLWGKPTVINNVETLACVALILRHDADWFAQYGTAQSKGTKTFALVGKVKRPGLVEVPLGITLREMIFQIGGGLLDDRPFKAVQTGGPSGGCLPAALLDTPVDYDSLKAAGSIMGSGGMVVMDDTTCMVNLARYFVDFVQKESCGKCPPCRLGTRQMLDILRDLTEGQGRPGDLDLLLELAQGISQASLCGLGQTAPNPVLTTLRYFRDEYDAHLRQKRCPAVVCKEIISSPCQHVCPIETEAPVYIALLAEGRFQEAFAAIVRDNPLPSVCARVCHHPCESSCQAGKWGQPIAVRALKRAAMDYAVKAGLYPAAEQHQPQGPPVAIVGSGPAGLMAGYCLAKQGYRVTVFEALPVAGGALALAIPEYRLPREQLNFDIENIRRAGVEIRTNTRIGKDIPFREILADYQAVFLASGAHKSRKLGLANEDVAGVHDALDFLKKVALHEPLQLGRRVGVVGGGNSAVDAARAAARLPGGAEVRVLYRRTRAEMPAFPEENRGLDRGGPGTGIPHGTPADPCRRRPTGRRGVHPHGVGAARRQRPAASGSAARLRVRRSLGFPDRGRGGRARCRFPRSALGGQRHCRRRRGRIGRDPGDLAPGGLCRRRRGDGPQDRVGRHGRRKAGCRNDRQASPRPTASPRARPDPAFGTPAADGTGPRRAGRRRAGRRPARCPRQPVGRRTGAVFCRSRVGVVRGNGRPRGPPLPALRPGNMRRPAGLEAAAERRRRRSCLRPPCASTAVKLRPAAERPFWMPPWPLTSISLTSATIPT